MTGDDRIESTPDRASASLNPQYSASELIKVVHEFPSVDREFPSVVREFSRVVHEFPSVVHELSEVDREFPSVDREFPSVVHEFPSVVHELSTVEAQTPKRGILVLRKFLKHLYLTRIGITIKHDDKGAVGDESSQDV